MDRIFIPLSFISSASLVVAMVLGLMIDDPTLRSEAVQKGVQYHFLAALAALVLATMVHAIVLTYFMGTGRWIEETSQAYRIDPGWYTKSMRIKYRTIPLMVVCFGMLVVTGALGAAADPASPMQAKSWSGVPMARVHLFVAMTTLGINLCVNWLEFRALEQNGQIVDEILKEVRRIRIEKGLAVEA